MKRNFYEILNATPNATLEELKTNYKHLILQCHPDKLLQQQQQQQQQQQEQQSVSKSKNNDADKLENDLNNKEFVVISEAWNCLKDPLRRKQYDAELLLNKFHTHNNIYAHIQLSEMKKCLMTTDVDDELELEGNAEDGRNAEDEIDSNKESSSLMSYFYTYDCRCGGQYIVDESAEQYCRKVNNNTDTAVVVGADGGDGDDSGKGGISMVDDDADVTQNKSSPNKSAGYKHDGRRGNGGDGGGGGGVDGSANNEGVAFDEDSKEGDNDSDDGELIVECSECSLVIILNG